MSLTNQSTIPWQIFLLRGYKFIGERVRKSRGNGQIDWCVEKSKSSRMTNGKWLVSATYYVSLSLRVPSKARHSMTRKTLASIHMELGACPCAPKLFYCAHDSIIFLWPMRSRQLIPNAYTYCLMSISALWWSGSLTLCICIFFFSPLLLYYLNVKSVRVKWLSKDWFRIYFMGSWKRFEQNVIYFSIFFLYSIRDDWIDF